MASKGLIEGSGDCEAALRAADRLAGAATPAFQFLLAAGGDANAPLCEDGIRFRNHCAQLAVETPLT
jgi:hypothetical protein